MNGVMSDLSPKTPTEVIDALGGTRAVSELLGVGLSVVSNWKKTETLPSKTYLILSQELAEKNIDVDPRLFGMLDSAGAA